MFSNLTDVSQSIKLQDLIME